MEAVPLPTGTNIATRKIVSRRAECSTRGDIEEGNIRNPTEMARANKTASGERESTFHRSLILSLRYGTNAEIQTQCCMARRHGNTTEMGVSLLAISSLAQKVSGGLPGRNL